MSLSARSNAGGSRQGGRLGGVHAAAPAPSHPPAHVEKAHAKFLTPPPPVHTAPLSDPFSVYAYKLEELQQQSKQLQSHHVVIDSVRILEDILVHAAQTFLEHRAPPVLLALSVDYARDSVLERLRDAEIISPWMSRQIDDARKLARWVLVSSAREVPRETSNNLLLLVTGLAKTFISNVERAAAGKPQCGCEAKHAFCRDMLPAHLDVVGGPHNAHALPSPSGSSRPTTAVEQASPAAINSPSSANGAIVPQGGLANPNGKVLKPRPRAHAALPYGWSVSEFESHCAPLHNTAHLALQAAEEAEEAAEAEALREARAARAEKLRLQHEAQERRRLRREAEEAARARRAKEATGVDGELSDLDENQQEEVDSEEERLTARRKSAREAAGEGAVEAADAEAKADAGAEEESEDSEEELNDENDEDGSRRAAREARRAERAERAAAAARDDALANEAPPPAPIAKTRFVFTFCCIVCHSVLLRGRDVDRVHNNTVWSVPGKNLHGKSVVKNFADTWVSRPADELEAPPRTDEEEEEPVVEEDDESGPAGPGDVPKDEGAAKREESIGVHCAGCDYYVGRFFPTKDAYRFIYISRASGQNFMYFTGDASVARLRPLLSRSEEELAEEADRQREEEEQQEDEEEEAWEARKAALRAARENKQVEPVVGLPVAYADEKQAAQFPFPRFGSSAPYNRPSSWQLFHTLLTDQAKAEELLLSSLPKGKANEEQKSNEPINLGLTARFGLTGLLSPSSRAAGAAAKGVKPNSKTFRPVIPPIPAIHSMLRRNPDSHYALPPEAHAAEVTADLSVLLWTDRVFHNRRAMDAVISRVVGLFKNFPSGVYTNTRDPPVPLFTYFFLPVDADFTWCRGTARYVFHFLTKKDDSKVKRVPYTYKKFLRALARHENAVFHLTAGGYGGHRFVLVKVGAAFRIFQSNHNLEQVKDRYTCLQWIQSDYPWSRTLDLAELYAFLAKFEEARRGRKQIWEELFTCGQKAQGLYDVWDEWQPDQVTFCSAKLADFAVQL